MSAGNSNGDENGGSRRRTKSATASNYVDRPYEVGKGKPPKGSQFKPGQPSPNNKGRPKGSTKATSLQKLLAKTVVATGPNGRRVRKTLGEVIDHKLIEMAANGDLDAIKLVKHVELQMRRFGLVDQPTVEDIKRQIGEEEELRRHQAEFSQRVIGMLEFFQHLKRLGLLHYVNGTPGLPTWVYEEARAREAATPPFLGPQDPSTWGAK